jgi:predicted PurR-regulated permease PerM
MRSPFANPWLWLFVAILVVLWLGRAVLGPFVVAGVIAYAFSHPVDAAQQRTGWPRWVIVALGYVVALGLAAVLIALLAHQAVLELTSLATAGPDAVASTLRSIVGADSIDFAGHHFTISAIAQALEEQIGGLFASPGDALHVATEAGSFLLDTFLVLVVTFYLLLDGPHLFQRTLVRVPDEHRPRLVEVLGRIHRTLGRWLLGQLFLIGLVATVLYIGLGPILHVPYALAVALLSGVLEILPLIGPYTAVVIAAVDAFAHGGAGLAAIVVVFYFVVRQVEDQVVMPVVIGRVVHLHPVVTIFAVLVGLSAFGILGGLLGVPVAAAANVVFNELFPPDVEPEGSGDASASTPSDA